MLKWKFPSLCDADLVYDEGQRETMLNKLMVKLNKSRSELDALFVELQSF